MVEILKQNKGVPYPLEKEVIIVFAGTRGYLDDIPVNLIQKFEEEYYQFIDKEYPDIPYTIANTKDLDQATFEKLDQASAKFKEEFKVRWLH